MATMSNISIRESLQNLESAAAANDAAILNMAYDADIDSAHENHAAERDAESARRRFIGAYHAEHTADWKTGENSYTVVTLMHPAVTGGIAHVFKVGRIVRDSESESEKWLKRRSFPLMQVEIVDGEIRRARFVNSKGIALASQPLADKRLAVQLVNKAHRHGFTSEHTAYLTARKAGESTPTIDSEGWDEIAL